MQGDYYGGGRLRGRPAFPNIYAPSNVEFGSDYSDDYQYEYEPPSVVQYAPDYQDSYDGQYEEYGSDYRDYEQKRTRSFMRQKVYKAQELGTDYAEGDQPRRKSKNQNVPF